MKTKDMSSQRHAMVEHQIIARGVRDPLVLKAISTVPREAFLPVNLSECAYEDTPLPIAANQTISQPYIVAFMIEALALEGGETVLEIGAGSGYAAAILSKIADEVYTVERINELVENASAVLRSLNYQNVHVRHADGTLGWPEHAPFDAIIVSASGPKVPEALKTQLKIGGRMVIPIGPEFNNQELVRITRVSETQYETEYIADVRFVPLIGEAGWKIKQPQRETSRATSKLSARVAKVDPAVSKIAREKM